MFFLPTLCPPDLSIVSQLVTAFPWFSSLPFLRMAWCNVCRYLSVPAAVLAEEQMTLDVQTGAKSKSSRSTSAAREGDEYGRPKVCDVRQLGCRRCIPNVTSYTGQTATPFPMLRSSAGLCFGNFESGGFFVPYCVFLVWIKPVSTENVDVISPIQTLEGTVFDVRQRRQYSMQPCCITPSPERPQHVVLEQHYCINATAVKALTVFVRSTLYTLPETEPTRFWWMSATKGCANGTFFNTTFWSCLRVGGLSSGQACTCTLPRKQNEYEHEH